MDALSPQHFLTQAHINGFRFSVKGDKLGVKPPLGGSITDPMRQYVLAMKGELLEILRGQSNLVLTESQQTRLRSEGEAVATKSIGKSPVLPLYDDRRQDALTWALGMVEDGLLPEPVEPITLPSGAWSTTGANASAWLVEAHARALRLRTAGGNSVDAARAFIVLRGDIKHLCVWACHAVLWRDSPHTHEGAVCLLDEEDD